MSISRAMLHHAAIHWSDGSDAKLCLLAVHYSMHILNRIPKEENRRSPIELFCIFQWLDLLHQRTGNSRFRRRSMKKPDGGSEFPESFSKISHQLRANILKSTQESVLPSPPGFRQRAHHLFYKSALKLKPSERAVTKWRAPTGTDKRPPA